MLVNYSVSNYASFDNEQLFSMEAGKSRSFSERLYTTKNLKILKFMAIYGANASGKSNLVSAIEFAKNLIINSIPMDSANYYCRFNDSNRTKVSKFEFTVEIDDKAYVYGFEILLSSGSFKSEWLKEWAYGNTYKTIFERDIANDTYVVNSYFKNSLINERLNIYSEDIKNDDSILFLRLMNQNKDSLYSTHSELKIYRKIFNWFKYILSVNCPDKPITNYPYLMDSNDFGEITKLLSFFGTGVSNIDIVDIPTEKVVNAIPKDLMQEIIDSLNDQKKYNENKGETENIPMIMIRSTENNSMFLIELSEENTITAKTMQFNHKNTEAIFTASEESDGTIRLLDLIEVLLTLSQESVYIIDEINRRLHPLLTYKFVEEYLVLAKKRKTQLIVTTHESKIMDLDLLRKDEINFVDKDDFGKTSIFTLDTLGERFDKKICKAYLKGAYNAIPRFINE